MLASQEPLLLWMAVPDRLLPPHPSVCGASARPVETAEDMNKFKGCLGRELRQASAPSHPVPWRKARMTAPEEALS